MPISYDIKLNKKIYFQKHHFKDVTSRFKIFGGETHTEFLNVDYTEEIVDYFDNDRSVLLTVKFFLSDKSIIHSRQVYDSMDLLEDAGG